MMILMTTVMMTLTLIPMMSLMGLTSSLAATLGRSPREKAEAPATIWLNLNLSYETLFIHFC